MSFGDLWVSLRNKVENFVMSVFQQQSAKIGAATLAAAQIGAQAYLSTQGDFGAKWVAARDAATGYASAAGVTIGEEALSEALETLLHLSIADASTATSAVATTTSASA